MAEAVTVLGTAGRPCGRKALGAPARHQGRASEVGEPTSGHWSTRELPAPRNTKRQKSPRDLHLNIKTQQYGVGVSGLDEKLFILSPPSLPPCFLIFLLSFSLSS